MKKILIILVLCSPLGWVAWVESLRLLNDGRIPIGVDTDDDEPKGDNAALDNAKKKADEVLKLSDDLVRSAVTLEDPPETSESGIIARELASVARSRKDHRKNVERQQDKAGDLANEIEENLKTLRQDGRPRDVPEDARKALMANLAEYEGLEVRDTNLIDSARAEAAWPKLDREHSRHDLDLLYEKLDRWTPQNLDLGLQTRESVKGHADAYRDYLGNYGKVKRSEAAALVREARERFELWSRGATLVAEVKDREAPKPNRVPAKTDAVRVRTVAELATTENPPEKFVTTARRLARILCGDMLPEEKLDEVVALNDGGTTRQIPRASLGIIWKDGSAATTLDKSRFNEFNLKVADVNGFVYNNESFDLPPDNAPPLTPTDYSKAVNAFNEERARVKRWSDEDLARLRAVCDQHRDVLGGNPKSGGKTLIDRIDALTDVVHRYPALFSNDSN